MILCEWNGLNCIGIRTPSGAFALRVANSVGAAHLELGFIQDDGKRYWWRMVSESAAITWFPVIKWKGVTVFPEAWTDEGGEPRLVCTATLATASERRVGKEFFEAAGWSWDAREGAMGAAAVQELELWRGDAPELL